MGRLRTEPKSKTVVSDLEYRQILGVLQEAQRAAKDNNIFFDLEDGEKASRVKRSFYHVAEREGMSITIRQVRGTKSLALNFKRPKTSLSSTRMSAKDSRDRILKCLEQARRPLKKAEIIKSTGISASTWNIRIKELLRAGRVERHGNRRDTTYTYIRG
ncbi:MAG: winged helix-turn-helix transcriptional regulator [Acidobacteria bacterium]|nr:winged helix-turn-helix transcriptional regulator [Acidobacteriota bacterium]